MPFVVRYPEVRESPNSDGSRIQPCPRLGAENILGCPDFPQQVEAAYFNVLFYRQLNYPAPAYAQLAEQEMAGDAKALRREAIAEAVKVFVKKGRYAALVVKREEPTPVQAPQQPQAQQPVKTGGKK